MMVVQLQEQPRDDTRERLLSAALIQFAERGFHGASIAQIAGEVGLTKQALLYHFKRKEDLYNEVLHRISQRLVEAIAQGVDQAAAPAARFEDTIMAIYNVAVNNGLDSKVLLRELLDDQRRDAPEDQWYFRQFLGHLVGMLDAVEGQAGRPFADKLAAIYALMSAIQFFTASGAVLRRFYGEPKLDEIRLAYAEQLRSEIRRMIADTL